MNSLVVMASIVAMRAVLLLCAFGVVSVSSAKTPIYLLGLYPISGSWPAGETILGASQLAADHVNQDSRILQDYELIIIPADSSCNGGIGTDAMFKELYNSSITKLMIIGPGCSVATEPTAESSHYWNLVQISYAANSPELSYREMYPRFFRLSLSEYMFNPMRIAVTKYFGWKRVATIHQRADFFSLADADFRNKAAEEGIEIITSEPFTDDPTSQVNNIKRLDARIIFCNSYEPQARKVFCAAWKAGLYGPKYVWIIPAWFKIRWWRIQNPEEDIDCTNEQMDEVTRGYFAVYQIIFLDSGGDDTFSGKSTSEYIDGLKAHMGDDVESRFGFQEAAYGYDTIWTMAIALNKTDDHLKTQGSPRSIADFDYTDVEIENIILEKVTNTNYKGLTGTVQFLDTGDRRGVVKLTQNQNDIEELVALFDLSKPEGYQLSFINDTPIIWNGGKPPYDATQISEELQTISISVFAVVVLLSICGTFLSIAFFAFNIIYRNNRFIKMSSPRINNLMLSGGITVYLSLILLGLDLELVTEEDYLTMTKAFYWTFTIGFSVFFGSMFSKTWRVHRIFTSKSLMPRKIKDPLLFAQVGVLVLLDVCVLVIWEIVDPLYIKRETKVSEEDPTNDFVIVYIYELCTSRWMIYWTVALYAKHGLLLMFGAFLAWETRKIYMPVLNDSKQIGTSVYVVMVSFIVGLPVSILVKSPNGNYCILALLIFITTTFTMCNVFIPKVKMRNEVYPQGTTFTADNIEAEHTKADTSDDRKSPTRKQKSSPGPKATNAIMKPTNVHEKTPLPMSNNKSTEEKAVNTSLSFTPAHLIDKHLRHRKATNDNQPC